MTIHIDLIDQSTRGGHYDWDKIAHAVQTQIRRDVAPRWGVGNAATVSVTTAPKREHWPVYLLDNSDVDGALGYHETDPNSAILPVGKIFVATDEKYGLSPSVTISHECVEIIGDPMACYLFPATASQLWAVELCDAVESDDLAYDIDGVMVSDFVTPQWFYGGTAPFSFRQSVHRMRTLAAGGYQAYLDMNTRSWKQITAPAREGVPSRSLTMGAGGRVSTQAQMWEWAKAVPQMEVETPQDSA